jgi:UMF1 family MFS transporter
MGVIFTDYSFFIQEGDWLGAVIFYILGSIGEAGANIFYDSLLPHVAYADEIDQVSSKGMLWAISGWAIVGSQPALVYEPEWFGFSDST